MTRRLLRWWVVSAALACGGLVWWLLERDRPEPVSSESHARGRPDPLRDTEPASAGPVSAERLAADVPVKSPPLSAHTVSPRASVTGTVLIQETGELARAGSVEIACVDPLEWDVGLEEVLDWSEEWKLDRESLEETPIEPDGTFRLELPIGALLRQATVKPASAEAEFLAGFLLTEQDLGEVLLGPEGAVLGLRAALGYTIAGRVIDAVSGRGVPEASVVSVWWNQLESPYGCRTDREGGFRIGGLDPDVLPLAASTWLSVRHEDYVPARVELSVAPDGALREDVLVRLHRGVVLRGEVLDTSGQGVPGATVQVLRRAREIAGRVHEMESFRSMRTDRDGSFRFDPLPAGGAVELRASHHEYLPGRLQGVPLQRTEERAVVTLERGIRFEIQALAPDGSALSSEDFRSTIERDGEPPRADSLMQQDGRAFRGFRGALGRHYNVLVHAAHPEDPGLLWRGGPVVVAQAGLPEGEEPVEIVIGLVELPLPAAPQSDFVVSATPYWGEQLALTFVQSDGGAPLRNAPLAILYPGGAYLAATTSHAGVVRLKLDAGAHTLLLRSPGYEELVMHLETGAEGAREVELAMRRRDPELSADGR